MLNLELKHTYNRETGKEDRKIMSTQNSQIQIIKRDGKKEPLDLEKMHKVVFYACRDLKNVSASQVEINSHLSFYNNINTFDLIYNIFI